MLRPPFYLPELNSLPAKTNGFITFGCFNNASKINDEILEKWAVILTLIPDSHLFLKSFNFKYPSLKENVYSKMEAWGIARERLRIEGSSPTKSYYAPITMWISRWTPGPILVV
ncbi:hypothetical protein ABC733_18585 [Mangrovibacter sp. SLW1]